MVTALPPTPQLPSPSAPHTCHHCSSFVIHLTNIYDEPQTSPLPPNPSQLRLAAQLYGSDFWSPDWSQYRELFLDKTKRISFFDATRDELIAFANDGCLFSRRFVRCLRDEDLPEKYAIGAEVIPPQEHGWNVELCTVDLDDLRCELLLPYEEDEEDPGNVYTVMAEKGSAAEDIIDKHPINLQPANDEVLDKAKSWLENCLQNHDACTKPDPAFTPTRLIQITPESRLREMDPGSFEPYAALSYCWGGDQVFKTTTQMLPRYLEAIDSTQLPQTLQDAIFVTKQLGLQYIWIDALCIIQDSGADKTIEIGRMARVYGNAAITIGATRASAVWNGFLHGRPPLASKYPNNVFSLPCCYKDQDMGNIILIPFTAELLDPLDTRGWTFQERVLSPRVLDFGTLRTQYTCQEPLPRVPSDGWSHLPLNRAYGSGLDARLISDLLAGICPPEEMRTHWLAVVQGFTSRGLTFATDKLPAIAGMAERFGVLMKDEYCAGLWLCGMPASLLWTAATRMQHINKDYEQRLSGDKVAAPSWSWAAVSEVVEFDASFTQPRKDIAFSVEVEDCSVIVADKRALYGAVSSGSLTLRAWTQKATWNAHHDFVILLSSPDSTSIGKFLPGFEGVQSTGITFTPDALEQEFARDAKFVLDVWLLLFGANRPDKETGLNPSFFGLVVRERGNEFLRVGVFRKAVGWEDFEGYMGWFREGGNRRFVVV